MTLCGVKPKVTGLKFITFKCIKRSNRQLRLAAPCWMREAAASFSILSRWLTGENDCYQPSQSSVNRAQACGIRVLPSLNKDSLFLYTQYSSTELCLSYVRTDENNGQK